jgi:hypothetical protein
MSFTTITLTGTYVNPDATPGVGTVSLQLTDTMRNAGQIIDRGVQTVSLVSGAFSIALAANDDAGTLPVGVAYQVVESVSGESKSYNIILPSASLAGTVDLSVLVPTTTVPNLSYIVSPPATTGQILQWSGTAWVAASAGSGNATSLQSRALSATAPTTGQVIAWNGTSWAPAAAGGGSFSALTGDATSTGTGGATSVVKVQNVALTAAQATLVSQLNNGIVRTTATTVAPGEETIWTGAGSSILLLPGNTTQNSTINTILNLSGGTLSITATVGTTINYSGTVGGIANIPNNGCFSFVLVGTVWYVTASNVLAGDATGQGGAVVVGQLNGTSLAALGTGLVKNTTGTGVPSIAVAGTDFVAPGGALGTPSSATLTNATGLPESGVVNLTTDLAARMNAVSRVANVVFSASPFSAAVNTIVPTDTTSGVVVVNLPAAPADKSIIEVKMVAQGGSNVTTINAGGSDHFNTAAGPTVGTLTLLNESKLLQYASATAIWTTLASDTPLAGLDIRYPLNTATPGGDLAGAGSTYALPKLASTVSGQAVMRAAVSQDIAERGGLSGAAQIPNGTLQSGVRNGTVDGILGDSISNGTGAQFGLTDWGTVLATVESRRNNQPDPGVGFLPARISTSSPWGSTNNSITPSSTNGTSTLTFSAASVCSAVTAGMVANGAGASATTTVLSVVGAVVTLTGVAGALTVSAYTFVPVGIMSGPSVIGAYGGSCAALLPGTGAVVADGVSTAGAIVTATATVTAGSQVVSGLPPYSAPTANWSASTGLSGTGLLPGTTVSNNNAFGSGTLSQPAVTTGTPAVTFARSFRRVKIYYQTILNGDDVTFKVINTSAAQMATSGSLSTHTAGSTAIKVWDSGDLGVGAPLLTAGVTAAWTTHSAGVGGAGVYVIGARYYMGDGTAGITVDNFGYGGTLSGSWVATNAWAAATEPNWAAWMRALAAAGTPWRRLYVMVGINDPLIGGTFAAYQTNLTSIVNFAKAASPLTEVVLCAEHYGDTIITVAACSTAGVTNGSVTVTGANITTFNMPVGATLIASTGTVLPTGMFATVTAVGTGACTVLVTGTLPSSATVAYSIANPRGGAANWTAWVNAAASTALATGAAFINLYERFGDISLQATKAGVTLTGGLSTVTLAGGDAWSAVKAGQGVWVASGTGTLANGTTVLSVSGLVLTLSQPILTSGVATLNFPNDTYGFGLASTPDIHFGDYTSSLSGGDGQRATAETFLNKLAFTDATPQARQRIVVTPTPGASPWTYQPHPSRDTFVSFVVITSATVALTYGPTGSEYTIYPSTVTTSKAQLLIPDLPAGWKFILTYSAGTPTVVVQTV